MTHIIILNWNGGEDTWRCVESVLPLQDVHITVFDNGSSDHSIDYLKSRLGAVSRQYFEAGYDNAGDITAALQAPFSIIRSKINLGFAAGVNCVLKQLTIDTTRYVWLLNNDALADKHSLPALIKAVEARTRIGFAGSLIMDANDRNKIQCAGVRYYKWLGVAKMQFKNSVYDPQHDYRTPKGHAFFQHGASLLIKMSAIIKTGLLDERFFLYAEEHDWQLSGQAVGVENVLAPESRVYHIGSMSTAASKHLFFYYYCKSSVLFSRKHHAGIVALTATCALFLITVIRTRGKVKSLGAALKGIKEAWRIQL